MTLARVILCNCVLALALGCSLKKVAISSMAEALEASKDVYARDEDPELVREAMPFALKTIESLLVKAPNHYDLLVSAASGFAQYAYAFVWLDAEELRGLDPERAKLLQQRAARLYLRARDYGLRALEVDQPRFREMIYKDSGLALKNTKRKDVPALYWTAVSWAAAASLSKGDMNLVADLTIVDAMIRRALELDESYDKGAIHEFLLTYEATRSGGSVERARKHFARAMELSGGKKIGPLVSLAENVSVQDQNRKEFLELLDRALSFDVNSAPEHRLANLLAQKRARQLKERIDDLFLEGEK